MAAAPPPAPPPTVSVPAPSYAPAFEPQSFENPVQTAMAELRRAEGLLKQGKYWDAIQVAEPLLDTVSGALLVRTRVLLGQAYLRNPNWLKRAAEQLQAAIESDPRHAEAHFALGLVYKASGLAQRAAAMFRKALELMPGHAEAQRELNALEPTARRKLFSR